MPSKKIKSAHNELESRILELIRETPLHYSEVLRALRLKRKKELNMAIKVLDSLERRSLIVKDQKNLVKAVSQRNLLQGKITLTGQGFGFVTPVDAQAETKDIFIPAKYVNSAMDRDLVSVKIIEKDRTANEKGPVGIVCQILERYRKDVIGELVSTKDGLALRPLNRRIAGNIRVVGSLKGALKGDWIKANISYKNDSESKHSSLTVCEVSEIIGKVGEMTFDMLAIIQEFKLCAPYSDEENEKALQLKAREIVRKDLTEMYSITIDPQDAKDFDDSISYQEGKSSNECIIGIHIADVAAWIEPNSYFDKEARERGFTAYIPGNTLPMLPKTLTKQISLTEGKESFAHSVILTINKTTGEITNYKRTRSTIRIRKRLNFTQVENYIKDKKVEGDWDSELTSNLDSLVNVYKIMREYRDKNEKFLNLSTTEIRILRDDATGEIYGLERKKQGEADQLVEEYMLAANSSVAKELVNYRIPGIYRIHPEPFAEKLEEFSQFVSDVFGLSTGNLSSGREACKSFLAKIEGKSYQEVVTSAFLQALTRASYSEKHGLHYGLGKGIYCHFTSPIRRYSDLIVHQQLWDIDIGQQPKTEEVMIRIASECTEKEKNTDDAYFAANDRLKLHYLQRLMIKDELETYEAIIRHVGSSCMFADITSLGISATIPLTTMHGDFKKNKSKLSSSRSSSSYKAGDVIFIQLEKIDFVKGDAIFRPVQY